MKKQTNIENCSAYTVDFANWLSECTFSHVSRCAERRAQQGVGGHGRLRLGRHAAEVALMQRRIEAALQGRVHVSQCHDVLRLLTTM